MTIEKMINGNVAVLKIAGALDTETAPELEALLASELHGVQDLTLDFEELDYVSSAGLRVMRVYPSSRHRHLPNPIP